MSDKTKVNRLILGTGAAFLLPPAWIVFEGLQNLAAFPLPVALFAIGGLAALAISLIFLGLQNLEAGDVKDSRLQFIGAALIMTSEFAAQWWFAITEHHALVTALVLSLLSVGGAVVIESEIMRVWKANARRDGLMSLPRAQVPNEVAREFPEVGTAAKRLAIRYPNATQASILAMAFEELDRRAAEPAPVQVRVDVREIIAGPSGQSAGQSAGVPAIESGPAPAPATLTELVKASMQVNGADAESVIADVLTAKPDAKPDTIRRTVRKLSALKSA